MKRYKILLGIIPCMFSLIASNAFQPLPAHAKDRSIGVVTKELTPPEEPAKSRSLREVFVGVRDEDGKTVEATISIPQNEQQGVSTFNNITFQWNSADITQAAESQLYNIAMSLNSPSISRHTYFIIGYTDSDGTEEYNRDLSLRRAESVKNYLIKRGVASHRLIATGRGEEETVSENGKENKAKSRRVSFVFYK